MNPLCREKNQHQEEKCDRQQQAEPKYEITTNSKVRKNRLQRYRARQASQVQQPTTTEHLYRRGFMEQLGIGRKATLQRYLGNKAT